ncbi:MAG: TIGR00730 family Rossman fold protein [Burkholderiales bacterium]|nr:TIGR00730 family Rossman fold protein [Burkholderiales bacterium]
MRSICVFCGSNQGSRQAYAAAARALARAVARAGLGLVYGGGSIGLMGVLAESALAAGVHVTGVAPRRLIEREVVHRGLTELHVVESMHERKAKMAALADAFLGLPGGYGTLDELFEALTWTQLGYHRKACGLLNVEGFFDGLAGYLDHALAERFLTREHREMLVVEDDPDRLIERLAEMQLPQVSKWIGPGET